MDRQEHSSVLCLKAVALAVLLLLLLAQDVQAQQQPAKDASWMPKVTTKSSARPGLAAAQQAGDTEADAPAVPMRRPGVTAGPQASKQTAGMTAGPLSQNPDAADPLSPEEAPASLPSKASTAGAGSAAAAGVQRAGLPTKPSAKSSKTPVGQSPKNPKAKSAAANPPGSLHNVLAKNTPLFRSLLTVLGIGPEDVPSSTVGTFFAPTDDAITEFLSSMGLSASQLAARPELVDLIVSYHFAPGYQVRGAEDVVGSSRVLLTGDEQYTMKIGTAAGSRAAGGNLTLSDVQKSTANVVDGPITPDNNSIAVFVIDKVLRSGNYFLNLESALGHSPYWISAKSLAVKAGVLQQLEGRPVTLLVPDNTAFKPLESNLSRASPGRLADILKYHVLPKVRRLPRGFEAGPAETLLKGHSVDINMTSEMQKDPFSGSKDKNILVPILRVSPEVGRTAQVNYYNIFAGPAILHGIDQLLMPDLPQDPNQLPAPPGDSPDGGGDGDSEEQQPEDEQTDAGPGAELAGPDSVGEGDGEEAPTNNSSAAGRARAGGGMPAAAGAGQRSMTPKTAGAGAGAGGGMILPIGSAAGRLRPATTPVSVEAGARSVPEQTAGSAAPAAAPAAGANGVRGSLPLPGAASDRLSGGSAAASGMGAGAAVGSGLRGAAVGAGAGTGPVVGPGLGPGGVGRKVPDQQPRAAAAAAAADDDSADAAEGPGRRLLQAAAWLWTDSTRSQLAVHVHACASTPRRMLASGLQTARALLQMTPTMRPRPATATASASSAPTALPASKAAGAATAAVGSAGKPSAKNVPAFGALSSAVPVGSVGQLQTFANGVTSNKTLIALTRASVPMVPKEYVNRYGSLKGPTVKGGCLNCKSWGGQPQ